MPTWNSYSYLFGPLMAAIMIGIFVLVLKWAFGKKTSVVAAPPKSGDPTDYGMLVPIASPGTFIEAEAMRTRLAEVGIKASVANTIDGPRLMVWPADVDAARRHVAAM